MSRDQEFRPVPTAAVELKQRGVMLVGEDKLANGMPELAQCLSAAKQVDGARGVSCEQDTRSIIGA